MYVRKITIGAGASFIAIAISAALIGAGSARARADEGQLAGAHAKSVPQQGSADKSDADWRAEDLPLAGMLNGTHASTALGQPDPSVAAPVTRDPNAVAFARRNRGGPTPEIDPGSMASALTLLVGGMLLLTDRFRRGKMVLA